MKEKTYKTIKEELCPFAYQICNKKEDEVCMMSATTDLLIYKKQAMMCSRCKYKGSDLTSNEYLKRQQIVR